MLLLSLNISEQSEVIINHLQTQNSCMKGKCRGSWETLRWLGGKQNIYGPEGNQSVPARPSDKYEPEKMESEEGKSVGK